MYSQKVMELFRHPHNIGEIKDADAIGKVGNVVCGDIMWVYIKVAKTGGKEVIEDIKVKTFGCVAAMATSIATTDMVKGKTLEEAMELTKEKVRDEVDGLPPVKFHCSILAVDGLKEAIYQYFKKEGRPIPEELEKAHQRAQKDICSVEHKHGHG